MKHLFCNLFFFSIRIKLLNKRLYFWIEFYDSSLVWDCIKNCCRAFLKTIINSSWVKRDDMKYDPYKHFVYLRQQNKTKICRRSLRQTLTSADVRPPPVTFSLLACTEREKAHRCKAFAHNPPPLGKLVAVFSWSEDGAVTDLLVSLVWAIREGRRRGREEEGIPGFQPGWSAKACSSPVPPGQRCLQPAGSPVTGTSR